MRVRGVHRLQIVAGKRSNTLFVFTTWSTRSSTEQVRSCRPLPGVSFSSGLGADRFMDHVVFPFALPGGMLPVSLTAQAQRPLDIG